ncbi:hypothetical protein ACVIGB_010290 [Bradyrhizobium sp. USDA 4341]
MADLAQLGLSVTTNGIDDANSKLDKFESSATAAGQAADDFGAKASAAVKNTGAAAVTGADRVNSAFATMTAGIANANKATVAANGVIKDEAAVMGTAKVATEALASAHAGLSAQGQTAFHIVRSGVEMLAQGVPVTRVAAMEMNHLAFAMTGEGGIKGAFGEVAGLVGNMLTPMRLVTGGVIGLAAGALYLGNSWSESSAQINRSIIGIGAATGATSTDLTKFASANSSATGLSIGEARNVAIEFTKTGNIAVQNLKGVGAAIHGYAVLTGEDATKATKDFASALSGDLVDGAKELNRTYGSMSSATLDYIQTLQVQGDRSKAQQVIIDSITPASLKAADSLGWLTKAYNALGNAMSAIKNGPAPVVPDSGPPQDRLQRATTTSQTAGTSFSGQISGGFGSDILGGADTIPVVNQLDDAIKQAQQDVDQFGGIGKEAFNKLSMEARNATETIFPQIEQIRKLEVELGKLQEAQSKGAAGPNADAGVTVYKNQIAALQDAKEGAELYNQRVAVISTQWGDVGQSAALALQAARNQLPVLEAVGGAAKMAAQYTADYKTFMDQGKSSTEAAALAASNLAAHQAQVNSSAQETLASLRDQAAVVAATNPRQAIQAQAQATYNGLIRQGVDSETALATAQQQGANALAQQAAAQAIADQQRQNALEQLYQQNEKAVQSSRDQVALYATQGSAEQAQVKAAIAYRQAIDAGADSTQAGIIAINTATVATAQWADQAQRAAQAMEDAQRAAQDAQFSDITPGGDNSFGFFQTKAGHEGNTAGTIPYWQQKLLQDNAVAPPGASATVDSLLNAGSGINSTLAALQKMTAGTRTSNVGLPTEAALNMMPGQLGLTKSTAINDSDIIGQVQALYDIKNSQTTDTAVKNANMQEELAWLNSRPESLARDQAIAQLTQAMQQNTDATSANTVSLNPLYNGRDALHVGYYKAASGLDVIAQGPSTGDRVPFHAMVNGGERITITPAGQNAPSNDNSSGGRSTVVNNNFTLPSAPTNSARRNQRQYAQGFGQTMAALS